MNSYILLDDGIMISLGMKPYNVERSHPNFKKILEAVKRNDWDAIPELANVAKALVKFADGKVEVDVDHGVVLFNGEELHGTLADRMLTMLHEGFTIDPLIAFLQNLHQNPSKRAVDELYGFLEHGKMPITSDGHFLAYKRVNMNYTSVYDSKTDNSIGKIVEMPRNKVDEDKDRTCSYGLHFCSHEYLSNFWGDRVVVLKVNPRDVVSIPSDYNDTKGRACRYEVVGELSRDESNRAMKRGVWDKSVNTDFDDRDVLDVDVDDNGAEIVSEDYFNGYTSGWCRGREDFPAQPENAVGGADYAVGYMRGHKDGKGHKAMPLFSVKGADERAEYNEGYDDGYALGEHAFYAIGDCDPAPPAEESAEYKRGFIVGYKGGFDRAALLSK